MKKYIIILLFLSIHIQSYCQNLTFSVNCSDSLLMTIKGKYIKGNDVIAPSTSSFLPKAQQPEVLRRMDAMHQLLLEAYPQPTGLEGDWWRSLTNYSFAQDVSYTKGIPVCNFEYQCALGYYTCLQNNPQEVTYVGFPNTPNLLYVIANNLEFIRNDMHMDTSLVINDRPVYMRNPVKTTWKGYEVIHCRLNSRAVILTRKDELPYTPVTRKQYLDYCLKYLNKFFDEMIKSSKAGPVRSLEEQEALKRKSLDKIDEDYKNNPKNRDLIKKNYLDTYKTDQQLRDETTNKITRTKDDVIKRYEAELEKAKAANLLDSPAVVLAPATISEDIPIFTTEAEDGSMLITENPAYVRKNLPKYVPQFIVLYWSWNDFHPQFGGTPGEYYRKMLEANFPIEKLQAMIDK